MTGWIALGGCVLAVAVLVAVALTVLRRLESLRTAQRRVERSRAAARGLAPAVAGLRERIAGAERELAATVDRAERLAQARRTPPE